MVRLTDKEQRMLDGKEGRLKQCAIENIIKYHRHENSHRRHGKRFYYVQRRQIGGSY